MIAIDNIDFYYSIVNTAIDRALDAGVFGVPTFIAKSELFWGNDRLILLRHYLNSQ